MNISKIKSINFNGKVNVIDKYSMSNKQITEINKIQKQLNEEIKGFKTDLFIKNTGNDTLQIVSGLKEDYPKNIYSKMNYFTSDLKKQNTNLFFDSFSTAAIGEAMNL